MNFFYKLVIEEINQNLDQGNIEKVVEQIFFFYRKKEYILLERIWADWKESLRGTNIWHDSISGKYLPYKITVGEVLSQPLKSIFNKRGWGKKKISNILQYVATAVKNKNINKSSLDNQIPKEFDSDKEIILTAEEIWNRWQKGETIFLEKIWFQWKENLKDTPAWNDFLYKWLTNSKELLPNKPLKIRDVLSQPLEKIFETRGWGKKKIISLLRCVIRAIEYTFSQCTQDNFQFQDLQTAITNILYNLDERSRQAIEGRFIEGKTLEEIGKKLNITREGVRQLIRRQLWRNKYILDNLVKEINNFLDEHNGFVQFDNFLEKYKVNEEKIRKFLYNFCCDWVKKEFEFVENYIASVEFLKKKRHT